MDVSTIIVGLSFLGAFVSVIAAGLPLVERDQLQSRLKAVTERRQELSAKQRAALQQQRTRFQPKRHIGMMKAILDRLNLQNMLNNKALKLKMAQAGWRRQTASVTYVFSRIALPLVFLVLSLLYLSSLPKPMPLIKEAGICIVAAAVGFYLPAILLQNTITKRQKELSRAFPDALDLMTICVEAGLSIEGAFMKVTEEMAEGAPEMAEEIGLTAAELAFLGDRRQAYENFAERTGLPSVKALATSLNQAEKYGTPISVSLRVISQENREARMALAEKKAASLPAQLTVPMIVFFLPVLFIVIIGPAAIKVSRLMG